MKRSHIFLPSIMAILCLMAQPVQASDEELFFDKLLPPAWQDVGHGRSAIWTLPLVATQYHPAHPTPVLAASIQAQREGRILEAIIPLDDAIKNGQLTPDAKAEIDLVRASLILQDNQPREALEVLAPLLADPHHTQDAYALTAMAHLQLGQMPAALDAAQHAHGIDSGVLSHLALSYALQGSGRLVEAREIIHDFNADSTPRSAVALAREAELNLTLNQLQPAKTLLDQARKMDASDNYVIAVSGLIYLIDGNTRAAKAAFASTLKSDPRDAKALFGLGLAEVKAGNIKAGQEKLQAADQADPRNALILTYLARSQLQLGQTAAARNNLHSAQQADPKDPTPWLYQAQLELQGNHPLAARESLREAQARTDYRSVYRGERLLKEDERLLQANLAEVQRQLGLENIAFNTLADPVGEKSSANLRNQAELLQGQRFAESARRSLLLQSLFNDKPNNLPAELDIYGDGAGQTGAASPQHGAISELNAQQTSYNNYDELFTRRSMLEADAIIANQNTSGGQIRLGTGSDTLGVGIGLLRYKTDGGISFANLDNLVGQGTLQWRPAPFTQAFVSHQFFNSQHGEILYPGDPGFLATPTWIVDNSKITRLGLRHSLADNRELWGVWSQQLTDQALNYLDAVSGASVGTNHASSIMQSVELQYRASSADHATQWGVQQTRGQVIFPSITDNTRLAQQYYVAWQQTLNPYWQLDAGLSWGKMENRDNTGQGNNTYQQRWQPQLGMVYTPDQDTHVRFAAWQGMGLAQTGDAALAPTSLAGILLSRPDDKDKLVQAVALRGDKQLGSWLLDGATQQRKTDAPVASPSGQSLVQQQTDESRLALHWQAPEYPLAASLAYDYERVQNPSYLSFTVLNSVQEQSLYSQQLALRWFASAQWMLHLTLSHNRVTGTLETNPNWVATLLPYQESFNQVDTELSRKFTPSNSINFGVRNATDQRFQYTNIDPLNPRFSNGRLLYAKIKLAF